MGLREKHQKLYNRIPSFKCKQCGECCGPVPFTKWERNNKKVKKDVEPMKMLETQNLNCPHRVKGKCEIYDERPLMCRMFGTVEPMPCLNKCMPDKLLTEKEANEIMEGYKKLS